jgi:hypothetical protein
MKHVAYSKADDKLINGVFDHEELLKRVPQHMNPIMQYIEEERTKDKEINTLGKLHNTVGWTRTRNMQRVACVPQPVWAVAIQIDEDLATNKAKFYRWLDNHPEYDMRGKVGE